jgi:ketosteroid isomerase-like protein
MNQTVELENLVRRSYDAVSNGDVTFFERYLSCKDGVLYIGTDPQEWVTGYGPINRIYQAQAQEMGSITIEAGDLQAYSSGDSGWVADRPTFRLPDGTAVLVRSTTVFAKEDGEWKVTHMHVSIGVPNQDVVGRELPLS